MASPKDLLEGKPLRSPLHPALVHLPIGLFPLSVVLDVASLIWPDPEWLLAQAALVAVGLGLATGLLAGLFGFVDYSEIRNDHPAKKTATLHMMLNLVALVIFGLSFGLRLGEGVPSSTPWLPLIISVVGLGILGYSGYLGGDLVYNDGVAVGRHRRGPPLPAQTVTAQGSPGAWVSVAQAAALTEHGTLRVEVNGTVMTLARTDGRVHAFQEFCTHRYGPLSEGAVHGCEIECPWHKSRFDVRTGAVTSGPAKVGLRVFQVEEREDKIWVEAPAPPTTAHSSR